MDRKSRLRDFIDDNTIEMACVVLGMVGGSIGLLLTLLLLQYWGC